MGGALTQDALQGLEVAAALGAGERPPVLANCSPRRDGTSFTCSLTSRRQNHRNAGSLTPETVVDIGESVREIPIDAAKKTSDTYRNDD
jgi:hypothetical protein